MKGHFGSELKFDTVVRLAALQIHVAMTSENEDTKFSLKDVSKEYGGLDDFLPIGIVNDFKKKDIKKALMAQLKSLSRISLPGQRLTSLQAKLHYLKIASQSPAFGGRILSAHIVNDRTGSDSSFVRHCVFSFLLFQGTAPLSQPVLPATLLYTFLRDVVTRPH